MLLLAFALCVLSSCTPTRWFLVNTNGILTYNRHTGQIEMIWEWNEKPNPVQRDSVTVKDSVLKKDF